MRSSFLVMVCTGLIAVGCAGPRPDAPAAAAVEPPTAWRAPSITGADPTLEWWKNFCDSGFLEVLANAATNNVDVAIAATRVAEARAQFRLSRAQQFPMVNAGISGVRERFVSPFLEPELQTTGQLELTASYDADLFGRLAHASDASLASLLAAEDAQDNVHLAVLASAANGYITLVALDNRLAVLARTLDARAKSLSYARRRANAGYSSTLDLAQAESEYRSTQQQIPSVELAIARQETGLSILMGRNPTPVSRTKSMNNLCIPDVPTNLPSELLRRRPDVANAEQQIVSADRALDSARAAFMPNLNLSVSGGLVLSTLLHDPIRVFTLGGSILAPLFEGGRLHAQADVAAARRDQAAFEYRKTALNAFREVEDALDAVHQDAIQAEALMQQRAALERALALATKRYREGYTGYLDQLDAQRALLAVELSIVQSQADRLSATVALYQALGGGWHDSAR